MRRSVLAGLFLPILLAAPAVAAPPDAATWAGVGYEMCPLAQGFPCSYHGTSTACSAVAAPGTAQPAPVRCTTSLDGVVGGTGCTTTGQFAYADTDGNQYVVQVRISSGFFEGSTVADGGPVVVSGTLHPFAGALRRWPYGAQAASGPPSCV